jgi:hypothetical protein
MAAWWRSLWVHGLLGPLVGALVGLALVSASGKASPPLLADVGMWLALAYLFGLGPALTAGVCFAALWRVSRRARQACRWRALTRLELAAAMGAVSGLLGCTLFLALIERTPAMQGPGWWMWLASALAGAVCGAYTARP